MPDDIQPVRTNFVRRQQNKDPNPLENFNENTFRKRENDFLSENAKILEFRDLASGAVRCGMIDLLKRQSNISNLRNGWVGGSSKI
jgi:hypothetical protein